MECNSDIWKESSIHLITEKLHRYENNLRDIMLRMKDRALEDITYEEMKRLVHEAGVELSNQEMLTLLRAMDKKRKGKVKYFRLFRILNDEDMFSTWELKSPSHGSRGRNNINNDDRLAEQSILTNSVSEFSSGRGRK